MLKLPVELFVNWLILEACKDPPEGVVLRLPAGRPRCRWCGRWLARRKVEAGLSFCDGGHADRYLEREAA